MHIPLKNQPSAARGALVVCLLVGWVASGCAVRKEAVQVQGLSGSFEAGQIISTRAQKPVSFEEMMADLVTVQVVYVGESHKDPQHHAIQLKIVQALYDARQDLVLGMEMFDHTYQEVLDAWRAGRLDQEDFLKKTHWYANWRYDYDLYADILQFARDRGIRLVGLNIPFHIPPKIAAGGIDSLGRQDRSHLPASVDTSNGDHRAYVEKIFKMHRLRGGGDFETFYEAQCVWEDAMAEVVARESQLAPMAVLAGNGHIIRKYGIPDRAHSRNGASFRTVVPVAPGRAAALDQGDYLWLTP
jgi:uncharacterized iron-regulated protein